MTRTLQRLLYYTSFPAGFICLDLPEAGSEQAEIEVRMDAAVGDFGLVALVDQRVALPAALLYGDNVRQPEQQELLAVLQRHSATPYQSFLRLQLPGGGVIVSSSSAA